MKWAALQAHRTEFARSKTMRAIRTLDAPVRESPSGGSATCGATSSEVGAASTSDVEPNRSRTTRITAAMVTTCSAAPPISGARGPEFLCHPPHQRRTERRAPIITIA